MNHRVPAIAFMLLLLVSCGEPSKGDQFWLNWSINLAVAIATLMAVGAALCGPFLTERIRAKWFAPRLKLHLVTPEGELGQNQYSKDGAMKIEPRRFYHLHVSNDEPYASSAEGVQVSLLRIETPGPGGTLQLHWKGNVPLTWRNQQLSLQQRTLGPAYDCDLCSIGEDLGISLALLIFPLNLESPKPHRPARVRLVDPSDGYKSAFQPLSHQDCVGWQLGYFRQRHDEARGI
jgi:hypothetical protein